VRATRAGVALALAGALLAAPAAIADETISAGPVPDTYGNPDVTIDQGEAVTFDNADPTGVFHDVTSDQNDGDGKPLFVSETIEGGKKAPVKGVEFLTTGDYKFHCSVHPFMVGTLHVTANGTPKPRTPDNPAPNPTDTTPPDATVKILDSRISKVLEHRGLRVRLQTNEPARFKLTATSGKTKVALGTVTSKGGKTVKLDLTKKGKQLLFKASTAKLKLTAKVNDAADNKSTASATRVLR
jgi:plastocyanin